MTYRKLNKEKKAEYNRIYNIVNKEKIAEYNRIYDIVNKEKIADRKNIYNIVNKEKIAEYNRIYNIVNKEKIVDRKKIYNASPEVRLKINKRRNTIPKINLNCRMSSAISHSLKNGKGGKSWLDLVDYTLCDLIKRLKKTLPKGYTWQDFLKKDVLHIDHIIPKSVYNYTKPEHEDFKRCWALENLQLLPAKENKIKGAKLEKEFQQSLPM